MNTSSLEAGEYGRVGLPPGDVEAGAARRRSSPVRRSVLLGLLASLGMLGVYLGIVTWAESWSHALTLFRGDAPLTIPIVIGFGVQIGLFTYLRSLVASRAARAAVGSLAGASGGTSAVGMAACCAHHVADVLPLVGLSGATVFLSDYRSAFMIAGLGSNVVAIAVLSVLIRRADKL